MILDKGSKKWGLFNGYEISAKQDKEILEIGCSH
jgi:hypothetical protein